PVLDRKSGTGSKGRRLWSLRAHSRRRSTSRAKSNSTWGLVSTNQNDWCKTPKTGKRSNSNDRTELARVFGCGHDCAAHGWMESGVLGRCDDPAADRGQGTTDAGGLCVRRPIEGCVQTAE